MTTAQIDTIACCDAWLQAHGLPTYSQLREHLAIVKLNARLIPDPSMSGATDCYAVPLDDIDRIQVLDCAIVSIALID